MTTYWHKQTTESPLFQDLLWSRPENKLHAGKLLVIGGNLHGFSVPAQAFNEASEAGVGTARVVLPSSIQKTVGAFMPEASFAPSTPSGSFAAQSLDTWLKHAAWSDATLLAGDLGRNSETAIVIESFLRKFSGKLALSKDATDYAIHLPEALLGRPETLLVLNFAQLQKLASNAKVTTGLTLDMGLVRLAEALHLFTIKHPVIVLTNYLDTIVVAREGQVSSTKVQPNDTNWQTKAAVHASVWWLQHPAQPFQAVTASIIYAQQNN